MLQSIVLQNAMNNDNSNELIMLEFDEVVVVSDSTKLRMPMMRVLCKSTYYEDLRIKIVQATIMSAVLYERHPQVDLPTNTWAKSCTNLHDTEIGVLRHCIPLA